LIAPNNTFEYWNNWIGYVQPNLTNAANTALDNAKQHGGLYINDPEAPPFERFNQLWRVDKSVSAAGADGKCCEKGKKPDRAKPKLHIELFFWFRLLLTWFGKT
jgi:hypothetical protein